MVLGSLSAFGAPGVLAQERQPSREGSVVGRVVDSETLEPLRGAVLLLRRVGYSDPEGGSTTYRSAVTDTLGEYRFEGLAAAAYRLHIRRVGFVADSLEIDLRAANASRVSIGLEAEPLILPAVEVIGNDRQPYTRTEKRGERKGEARILVDRIRQEEYLAADVRELTHGEVVEAATLAESDLFRALQRVPGVGTRDDYTATLWTRGASWDQTRVYFDGLPLYNPTHAGWLFSAINPDAVGSVTFHPGVRSAKWGEGAAAILDLSSRLGGEGDRTHGQGELSLASFRFALDGSLLDRKLLWMVAARRTYVDVLTGIAGSVSPEANAAIPYDFSDVVARVGGNLGKGWEYSGSAIVERDRLRGDVHGLIRGNHGRWGNRSGQLSLTIPLSSVSARVSAGETRFRAAIVADSVQQSERSSDETDPTLPAVENTIHHKLLSVELSPEEEDESSSWSVGYQYVRDEVRYRGPVSLLSALAVLLPRGSAPPGEIRSGTELRYHALWGEVRQEIGDHLELDMGARLEVGDRVPNGGEARLGPRVGIRWRPSDATLFTGGWSRTFQYTQDVAPVAGPLGPQLHLSHLWVLAEIRRYAAMRADIVTFGVERWLASGTLGSVNVYRRATSGLAIPNPMPGRVTPDRDPDAVAKNSASGIEFSVRRLAGRWTGSLGYSFGSSTITEALVTTLEQRDTVLADFPSSAEIRHALDVTGMFSVNRKLRVGGSLTVGSGVPFTRLILPGSGRGAETVWLGDPNAGRTPAYASLDLSADYTTTLGTWQLTAFAQLRNLLNRENRVTYARSRECQSTAPTSLAEAPTCTEDIFERGIPRLPLVGLRMSF